MLLAASAAALTPQRRVPPWCLTLLIATIAVIVGVVPRSVTGHALGDLAPALAFLALAVPLAVLLDETGFFAARVGGPVLVAVGLCRAVQVWLQ